MEWSGWRMKAETALRILTIACLTMIVAMVTVQIQIVVLNVLAIMVGRRMKVERSVPKTSMNVKEMGISATMEHAQIQRVVLTALATRAGRILETKLVEINLSLVSCDKIHANKFQVVKVHC